MKNACSGEPMTPPQDRPKVKLNPIIYHLQRLRKIRYFLVSHAHPLEIWKAKLTNTEPIATPTTACAMILNAFLLRTLENRVVSRFG